MRLWVVLKAQALRQEQSKVAPSFGRIRYVQATERVLRRTEVLDRGAGFVAVFILATLPVSQRKAVRVSGRNFVRLGA